MCMVPGELGDIVAIIPMAALVAMVLFARRVAHFVVNGELFLASSNDLTTQFDYADDPERIVIDMWSSHIWDASTVAALDAIVTQYEQHSKRVVLLGMNDATTAFHGRLTGGLGSGH